MGITICSKHGTSGILPWIEKELCQKITKDIYVPQDETIIVDVDYYDNENDDKFMFNLSYLILKSSFKQHHLKEHYEIHSDEEELELLKPLHNVTLEGGVCGNCYKDYMTKYKWDSTYSKIGIDQIRE